MLRFAFSVLVSIACSLAIPASLTHIEQSGAVNKRYDHSWPVDLAYWKGQPGFLPLYSYDNGTTWENAPINALRPVKSLSTVVLRDETTLESTVYVKNIQVYDGHDDWDGNEWFLFDYGGFTEEIFGVWSDRALITTDFLQRPSFPVTPGEWVPVPMSVDVSVVNAGNCELGVYNMTVFYNDGTAPLVVSAGGNPFDPALQLHIPDVYVVKNMTLSFGPILFPGTPSEPLLIKYLTAENAPSVTANIELPMTFCDVDE